MFRAYVFLFAVILSFAAVPDRSPAIERDVLPTGPRDLAPIQGQS